MSSLECLSPEARNDSTAEASVFFKRKLFAEGRWLCPRRYVIALMLFILLLLKYWSILNITDMIIGVFSENEIDEDIVIGHWTADEFTNYFIANGVVSLLAPMPGALLVFKFTSYKYLLLSTIATSILHMLTPVVLRHHSITFILVLLAQEALEAPVYLAIISMWKDWAPPLERTKLIIFSVFGIFIGHGAGNILQKFLKKVLHIIVSRFYLLGVTGFIWALFWYNIISDTPQNDPLISEKEFVYLECSIPKDQQKKSLKDIPWKSIVTSKPIAILGVIFLKMSVSRMALMIGGFSDNRLSFYLPAFLGFVFFTISSAVLADFLIKKFSGRTLFIRRCFLCGGFILQICFMCGMFASSSTVRAITFALGYMMYAASFPGFFTLSLDLSPRYVAIISGIVYTFFSIGGVCIDIVLQFHYLNIYASLLNGLVICDCILSVVCSGLFYKWGEVEEQLWSLAPTFPGRKPECSVLYPKTELQDDLNLVPENI